MLLLLGGPTGRFFRLQNGLRPHDTHLIIIMVISDLTTIRHDPRPVTCDPLRPFTMIGFGSKPHPRSPRKGEEQRLVLIPQAQGFTAIHRHEHGLQPSVVASAPLAGLIMIAIISLGAHDGIASYRIDEPPVSAFISIMGVKGGRWTSFKVDHIKTPQHPCFYRPRTSSTNHINNPASRLPL